MEENNNQIKTLITKSKNTLDYIFKMMENDNKFVFSEDCSLLLDEYFKIIDEVNELRNKNVCRHDLIPISNNDDVFYECKICKNIF